jgi:hypothetical protein
MFEVACIRQTTVRTEELAETLPPPPHRKTIAYAFTIER